MKSAIAALLGSTVGALCGVMIGAAIAVNGPSRELAARKGDLNSQVVCQPERPTIDPSFTLAPVDLEPVRSAIDADSSGAVQSLTAELVQVRSELEKATAQLQTIRTELAFARAQPTLDFLRRFREDSMTRGLTDREKLDVFYYVVEPMWELPEPEQVRPLADAIARYKSAKENWDWEWAEDPAGPQGNPEHPDAQRLTDEFEAIRLRWVVELGQVLGDQDRACLVVR